VIEDDQQRSARPGRGPILSRQSDGVELSGQMAALDVTPEEIDKAR
jgi:hypothetical protein